MIVKVTRNYECQDKNCLLNLTYQYKQELYSTNSLERNL